MAVTVSEWDMQTVIVKKSKKIDSVTKAKSKIKGLAKRIYTSRETSDSYRFRQRPPEDFVKGTFRTEKINEEVTVIWGKLK